MTVLKVAIQTVCVLAMYPLSALAQDPGHGEPTGPYAGFESREIAGLSAEDIAELRRGGGWGLALPAELNGFPGPAHLLELREELGLSTEQIDAISDIHEEMRSAAIAAAERFISAEAALSDAFAEANLSDETLFDLLSEAERARTALRFVHLSSHLTTPAILTQMQLARYAVLRGYADNACETIPDGHNSDMWRRHNGCD